MSEVSKMEIELVTGLQSHTFEVTGETEAWIKAHLNAGREFEILFPDFECE